MQHNTKKILLITPYFAPQSHAAMFRVYKLAKYLPEHGYEVHVLTVDTNYLYNEDPSLMAGLPESVKVHTARYIEPSLRGLRMAIGGQDRTFYALKLKQTSKNNAAVSQQLIQDGNDSNKKRESNKGGKVAAFKRFMSDRPDRLWTWYRPALKQAKHLIETHRISLIYTTSAPYTTLKMGKALQASCGVKWVADFRDPLGYGPRFSSPRLKAQREEQRLVKEAMQSADHIVGLAQSYHYIFKDLYAVDSQKMRFIPTGADDQYMQYRNNDNTVQKPHALSLIFIGEFLDEYDSDYIFQLISAYAAESDAGVVLRIIGREEVNRPRVEQLLSSVERTSSKFTIEFIDHLPQHVLYQYIEQADAGILIPGESLWFTNFAKLVDYLAFKKPVLADVAKISEARSALAEAGLGLFLTGDMDKDKSLLTSVTTREYGKAVNHEYCRQYLASSQVSAFVDVFDRVVGS
ncbi:hypothetical protein OE749_18525 [Aestuariibacter sp. AA17]|uniref:Glycosyltransferase subfamily 4-like N-terminal domain-containing protein n=1 Tax=Fluctibacter corallii TaxID=2984329 RepID=A0ABT3ADE1_9ALTE|nr:hypothetical protein [Aestuariibacter sp. AA17]MCV2886691.1 hypothetical protein [Aestuariibacter sp. AA17]